MSNYKLKFKLKQHTPIIHFHPKQHGATLRASELKPKLDKFLINKSKLTEIIQKTNKDVEVPKKEYESWFNNKEKLSLDYKVRIMQTNPEKKPINKNPGEVPFYFGNMGDDYYPGKMALSYESDEIECFILTFNNKLRKEIEKRLVEFFELNNFGTRQSKGWGSFIVSKILQENKWENVKFNDSQFVFSFYFPINNNLQIDDFIEPFQKAEWFYKSLRSGINLKKRASYNDITINGNSEKLVEADSSLYFKSLLFLYLFGKGIQWDKKTIKEKFFNYFSYYKRRSSRRERNDLNKDYVYELGLSKQTEKYGSDNDIFQNIDSNEIKLWRDLFGLSSNEQWRSYGAKIEKLNANRENDTCAERSKSNVNKIERFKSPIFIKPIVVDNKIMFYIKAFNINPNFLNQWFIISKGNRTHDKFCIRTSNDFSFASFFDWIINSFDFEHHISTYDSNNRQARFVYEALEDIYSQITNHQS